MKHFYAAWLLSLFLFCQTAHAQWQWLNPKPNTYANRVVRFADANHGAMLQELGLVLYTTDAGATWQEGQRFTDAGDLAFSPQGVGYLLTKPGVLWRSPDAGRTWSRVSGAPQVAPVGYPSYYGLPPLQHTYSRLHAISADTLVEVATDGLVRRSADGGQTWQQADSKVTQVLSSSFPSGRVGYLGTSGGRVYKTTNGGATWVKLTEVAYFPSDITMLKFSTPRLGYAFRGYGDLLYTADGGQTWALAASQLESISDLQFVSPTVSFAVGNYGAIYTITPGSSWTLIGPATTSGFVSGNAWASVWFTSPTTGYVAGRSSRGSVLRTTDGGRTWLPQAGRLGTIQALVFPGHGLTGYALSGDGLLKTTDGGDTWAAQAGVGGTLLACPDASTILIAGAGGTVQRSGDGGQSWQTTVIPGRYYFSNDLVALCMVDSQVGYVAGQDGPLGQVLARTADGGRTWQVIAGQQMNGLRNFNFLTPTTGFATGAYQGLYKTTDGGQTWQTVPLSSYSSPNDVCFVDAQVGYAIDDYSNLYKTQDGGSTWVSSQLNRTLYGSGHALHVHFLDRNVGCVQTDNADVFRTTDGGRTWLWEFNLGSRAMDYTQQGQALVLGGGNGMLVRRSLATNPLPFQARVLAPLALTDSSVVLSGSLSTLNCIVDSARFEFGPVGTPGYGRPAAARPVSWYGGDSLRTSLLTGLAPATTYRVRLRVQHNKAYYYSADTVFTTADAPPAPEPAAYPNPTSGYVRVVEPGRQAAARIEVFTPSGTLVRATTGAGVDLAGLPGGLYLLRVRLNEHDYHYRIVKQ